MTNNCKQYDCKQYDCKHFTVSKPMCENIIVFAVSVWVLTVSAVRGL